MGTLRRVTAKWINRDRNIAPRTSAPDRAQGHETHVPRARHRPITSAWEWTRSHGRPQVAIQEMIEFPGRRETSHRHQAYQLVSLAGNVAVTQLVDKPNHGVHVRLPKSIFRR